ncbi:MAG: hypothetical protein ACK5KN_07165 [Dysgonomonas sp.]|uniref:hypothetical protein n=1 Tax=Dysgonomonas sp. TaxID=1891233 RepID=UPI003A8C5D2C
MKTLQLTENEARKLYRTSNPEWQEVLERNFGADFFSQSVTDRIKTYEDACNDLGEKPIDENTLTKLGLNKNDIAYMKLATIARALNEGWVAKVYDNANRWSPWFVHNGSPAAFAFDGSGYADACARAGSGSRLALKSEKLANYMGTQFLDLWREFIV